MFPKRLPVMNWPMSVKPEVPKILTFDAYNTLYATTLPVMEQYCLVAKKYGIQAEPSQLTRNFPTIFQSLKDEHPNYGKHTNITAKEWWAHLITNIFGPLPTPREMIDEILERFEGLDAYVVYPDLLELLKYIKKIHPNVVLGIISNSDPVFYTLIKNIGLFEYFDNNFFLSYDLEMKKPSKEIFQYAIDDIVKRHPDVLQDTTKEQLKKYCWHIGDEAENDMMAANSAGWNGVLIDRVNKYGYFSKSSENIERDEHSISVDKIDNIFENSWEQSMKQNEAIQLGRSTFVISNCRVLKSILF